MASLVVFAIALPLSLGIAGASGTPPVTAVVAILAGGIVTGLLSGAPLVVSGPAAGLSALTLQFGQQYGLMNLPLIVALAGVFQLAFAAARLGRFMEAVPKLVIEGILSAIGLIIVIGQLHVISGHAIPGSPLTSIAQLPLACRDVFDSVDLIRPGANGRYFQSLEIGVLALVLMIAWPRVVPGRWRFIPGALPAIVITTAAGWNMDIPHGHVENPLDYSATVFTAIANSISMTTWSSVLAATWATAPAALGLAVVASVESLLTAGAIFNVAQKHHIPTTMQSNRELAAQGTGNIASGLLGGLPVSGVMVRSAANIESGARTRRATILHALWIFPLILGAPGLVAKLPYPALAAILIVTGAHLVNLRHMVQAVRNNPARAWIWPATVVAVLATDLLRGLVVAVFLAAMDHFLHKETPRSGD
jgi:MFS superfamily sulfate permease-like transporter